VLFAASLSAQNIATGSAAIPAAGRTDTAPRSAVPPAPPAAAIDYDTIHLEKRLTAIRASGTIMLDGALD